MRVLVTGCCGFIGSNFVHHLLDRVKDVQILNLDCLSYAGNPLNTVDIDDDPRYQWEKTDIVNYDAVLWTFRRFTPDIVINFAAQTHVDRSIFGAQQFITTNVQGTFNLIDVIRELGVPTRFVQVSTDEVYGSVNEGECSEDYSIRPRNPYSASKAAADCIIHSYLSTHEVNVGIVRGANNYGPYQMIEKFIPIAITRLLEGKQIPIHGDGSDIREWIYVDDFCSAVWCVATRGVKGEIYNAGTSHRLSILNLARDIIRIMGRSDSEIGFIGERPGHDRRYAMNSSKIRRDLSWEPHVKFEDGLRHTVEWYTNNREWWLPQAS